MRIRRKKESAIKSFESFLKESNCTYDIQKEDNATVIRFDFQAGHFVASFRPQDDCVEITYPCIASFPMSQLNLVRSKCNERNNRNILFKFSYSIDHEHNEVNVHISFFNNIVNPDEMKDELSAVFRFQRDWVKDFDDAVDQAKNYETSDLESELYKNQRDMFLLRCQEIWHHGTINYKTAPRYNGTKPLELDTLLETIAPLPDARFIGMNINTADSHDKLEDEQEIRRFDLRHALIKGEGKEAEFAHDYATIDLHYKQGLDEKPMMATIALTAEGADDHCLYTRVTVTLPVRNISRFNSLNNEERMPHSTSVLIALERNDESQHYEEFKYMWTDAQIKAKNGETDALSEDQWLLLMADKADVGYNLYWGQQYFHSRRFYEAILHLENVFNSYRRNFFEMNSDQKRMFMDTAYKLGFCFNELGLYKQAFFYLDLVSNDGNIKHTMELVNAMANGKDLRVFSYTDNVMEEVKRNFEKEDEVPENIRQFINFLRRRRGYSLINFNQLDQAEKLFTRMLDESDNADYAIHELAYIKQLRETSDESEPSSTPTTDDNQ